MRTFVVILVFVLMGVWIYAAQSAVSIPDRVQDQVHSVESPASLPRPTAPVPKQGATSANSTGGSHAHKLSTSAPQAGTIYPPLSTNGTSIVDAHGNTVVFHGLDISGTEWGTGNKGPCNDPYGCYWVQPSSELQNLAQWGFNVVRLPISWANLEPEPGQCCNETYLSYLDSVVSQLNSLGVAVIFSMHQWAWGPSFWSQKDNGAWVHGNGEPPWLYPLSWFMNNPVKQGVVHNGDGDNSCKEGPECGSDHSGQKAASEEFFMNMRHVMAGGGRTFNQMRVQDEFLKVWRFVAHRYQAFPNVIGADLFNEPYGNGEPPDALENFYLRAGIAVSQEAPNWLLVFEQSLGDQLHSVSIFLNSPAFQNKAVYSSHDYDGAATNFISTLSTNLALAQKWKVPYWVGEFHVITYTDSPAQPCKNSFGFCIDQTQTSQIMNYMKQNNIGWTYWSYSADVRPIQASTNAPVDIDLVQALQGGF